MTLSTFFLIMMLISMAAVVGVLVAGITVMTRGGELNKKYGNKLMQWRVICQGLAVVFLLLTIMTRGQ